MCLHKIITPVHIVNNVGIFLNEKWNINFKLFLLVFAEESKQYLEGHNEMRDLQETILVLQTKEIQSCAFGYLNIKKKKARNKERKGKKKTKKHEQWSEKAA